MARRRAARRNALHRDRHRETPDGRAARHGSYPTWSSQRRDAAVVLSIRRQQRLEELTPWLWHVERESVGRAAGEVSLSVDSFVDWCGMGSKACHMQAWSFFTSDTFHEACAPEYDSREPSTYRNHVLCSDDMRRVLQPAGYIIFLPPGCIYNKYSSGASLSDSIHCNPKGGSVQKMCEQHLKPLYVPPRQAPRQ